MPRKKITNGDVVAKHRYGVSDNGGTLAKLGLAIKKQEATCLRSRMPRSRRYRAMFFNAVRRVPHDLCGYYQTRLDFVCLERCTSTIK